jgi:hypothetical protein
MARSLKLTHALLIDLEVAFESSDAECTWYLDLERGLVPMVTDEIFSAYKRVTEQAEELGIEFADAVAQSNLPDWEKEAVLEADGVQAGLGITVIAVEQDHPHDAY